MLGGVVAGIVGLLAVILGTYYGIRHSAHRAEQRSQTLVLVQPNPVAAHQTIEDNPLHHTSTNIYDQDATVVYDNPMLGSNKTNYSLFYSLGQMGVGNIDHELDEVLEELPIEEDDSDTSTMEPHNIDLTPLDDRDELNSSFESIEEDLVDQIPTTSPPTTSSITPIKMNRRYTHTEKRDIEHGGLDKDGMVGVKSLNKVLRRNTEHHLKFTQELPIQEKQKVAALVRHNLGLEPLGSETRLPNALPFPTSFPLVHPPTESLNDSDRLNHSDDAIVVWHHNEAMTSMPPSPTTSPPPSFPNDSEEIDFDDLEIDFDYYSVHEGPIDCPASQDNPLYCDPKYSVFYSLGQMGSDNGVVDYNENNIAATVRHNFMHSPLFDRNASANSSELMEEGHGNEAMTSMPPSPTTSLPPSFLDDSEEIDFDFDHLEIDFDDLEIDFDYYNVHEGPIDCPASQDNPLYCDPKYSVFYSLGQMGGDNGVVDYTVAEENNIADTARSPLFDRNASANSSELMEEGHDNEAMTVALSSYPPPPPPPLAIEIEIRSTTEMLFYSYAVEGDIEKGPLDEIVELKPTSGSKNISSVEISNADDDSDDA